MPPDEKQAASCATLLEKASTTDEEKCPCHDDLDTTGLNQSGIRTDVRHTQINIKYWETQQ